MRIDIKRNESVRIVCDGNLVFETDGTGSGLDSEYFEEEVVASRHASAVFQQLKQVTCWQSFGDGVDNVLKKHPMGGDGFISKPSYMKISEREYEKNWLIGEFFRKMKQ